MEIVLSILGIPFIVAGIIYYQKGKKLFQNGIRVKGEIVDLIKRSSNSSSSSRGPTYYPVIAFQTAKGQGAIYL